MDGGIGDTWTVEERVPRATGTAVGARAMARVVVAAAVAAVRVPGDTWRLHLLPRLTYRVERPYDERAGVAAEGCEREEQRERGPAGLDKAVRHRE